MNKSKSKKSEIKAYDDGIEEALNKYWGEQYSKLYEYGPMGCVEDYLSTVEPEIGLDLACGRGWHTNRLLREEASKVVGIDISSRQLQSARQNVDDALFIQADAENIPLPDNYVDVVLVVAGLHHLPNLKGSIDEICRILKEDGALIFAEAALYNPLAYIHRNYLSEDAHTEGEQPLRPDRFEELLNGCFSQTTIDGHFLASPVLPFVANYLPIRVPFKAITGIYDIERKLLRKNNILSANITGIARYPR